MSDVLSTLVYEDHDKQVCWKGYNLSGNSVFDAFIKTDVASRLNDQEGTSEFESHLRGLALTGFGKISLEVVLDAETSEERDWAVGEALAEAWLSREYNVIWPWNMERDKRNANASLPGADLVGFVVDGADTRLVVGEVKSSNQNQCPPNVLYGRGGLIHQIDRLANDLGTVRTLLRWLMPRCKNTKFEDCFNASAILYFNSGNKAVSLFGVLIRDTKADARDLNGRGKILSRSLNPPTSCLLLALYLPFKIVELPERVKGGSAS